MKAITGMRMNGEYASAARCDSLGRLETARSKLPLHSVNFLEWSLTRNERQVAVFSFGVTMKTPAREIARVHVSPELKVDSNFI